MTVYGCLVQWFRPLSRTRAFVVRNIVVILYVNCCPVVMMVFKVRSRAPVVSVNDGRCPMQSSVGP
jgi:membrane-bound metal-dependent hydrolase YbcI (DUF457 family)